MSSSLVGFWLSLSLSEWTNGVWVEVGHGGSTVQLYTMSTVWHVCLSVRCMWSWFKDSTQCTLGDTCVCWGSVWGHGLTMLLDNTATES